MVQTILIPGYYLSGKIRLHLNLQAIPQASVLVYDVLVRLLSAGRERTYREKMLELAGLKAGESVLDVGCGTGTLAIAAKHRVGSSGRVYGIDASPEMIARARKKAAAEITFEKALVENLPFQDTNFDVVLCTTVLDHLPDKDERFALHPRRLADEHMMHRRTIATTP